MPQDKLDEVIVAQVASGGNHAAVRLVRCLPKVLQVARRERRDRARRAEDWVTVRVGAPDTAGVQIKHQILWRVLDS